MNIKGGRVTIEVNGRRVTLRGDCTIMPNRVELEGASNMDGTGYRTLKPVPASAEMSFEAGSGFAFSDADLQALMNVSILETDTRIVHTFTNAGFVGKASLNTADGSVSGLSIQTDQYDRSNLP